MDLFFVLFFKAPDDDDFVCSSYKNIFKTTLSSSHYFGLDFEKIF